MNRDQLTVREEVERWQRRDVTIDFVCVCIMLACGIPLIGLLLPVAQ